MPENKYFIFLDVSDKAKKILPSIYFDNKWRLIQVSFLFKGRGVRMLQHLG